MIVPTIEHVHAIGRRTALLLIIVCSLSLVQSRSTTAHIAVASPPIVTPATPKSSPPAAPSHEHATDKMLVAPTPPPPPTPSHDQATTDRMLAAKMLATHALPSTNPGSITKPAFNGDPHMVVIIPFNGDLHTVVIIPFNGDPHIVR
jgi:hypothetical protein